MANPQASHDALPLHLKPIISYPSEAQVGQRYVMTIDVQLAIPNLPWQYAEEEYPITFLLNAYPYFKAQPLSSKNPTLVLHRLGGTYGPVEYLLTAADHEIPSGKISLTFLNASGIPITKMELTCCIKDETLEQMRQREIRFLADQAATLAATKNNSSPDLTAAETSPLVDNLEPDKIRYPHMEEDLLTTQLRLTGWHVLQEATEDEINAGNIALRFYYPENGEQYLLFIQGELVAIISIEPLGTLLTSDEAEVSMSETQNLLSKVAKLHELKPSSRSIIPFIYNATGAETHFTNFLEPAPRPRRVFTFHRPETLALWLTQSPPSISTTQNNLFRSRLRRMPPLQKNGLFEYQVDAIQKLEHSLITDKPRTLLQMSAGLTFIIMSSVYRLLEYGNARKILLLSDVYTDTDYMQQSFDTYFLPEYLCYFSDRYPVRSLKNNQLLPNGAVYIMSMEQLAVLLSPPSSNKRNSLSPGPPQYRSDIPFEYFDVVFIRNWDSDTYQLFRNFLEYFDAYLLGIEMQSSDITFDFYQYNLVFKQEDNISISPADIAVQCFKHYYPMFYQDNLPYLDYIEQLSLLLFMKIVSEHDSLFADIITENFWQNLQTSPDTTLVSDCQVLLHKLSKQTALPELMTFSPLCKISSERKLLIIIALIDYIGRTFMRDQNLGDAYDEMLTKIAAEANSALSHHHTSRILTQTIVEVMRPQPGIDICDPACGTGGFLISAQAYIAKNFSIQLKEMRVVRRAEITGWEINESVARIAAINLWFHGLSNAEQSPILLGNSLYNINPDHFDQVFCNPLFAQDTSDLIRSTDFSHISTDDPLLNMLQHIVTLLKPRGKAAIIVPDSLLSVEGTAALVREQLLRVCDLHTLLRLPSGLLPTDIAGNVLFFDKPAADSRPRTSTLWIYNYRTNQSFNPTTRPITLTHLEDFVRCYSPENRVLRQETERFRRFSYSQLQKRNFNLDITW